MNLGRHASNIALLIVFSGALSCASSEMHTVNYERQIHSDPAGAEVRPDDADEELIGHTPLAVDGEITVKRKPSTLSKILLGIGGGYGALGIGIGVPTMRSDTFVDSTGMGTGFIISGVAVGALFALGARYVDDLYITSSDDAFDGDIKVGKKFRSYDHDDFRAAIPTRRYWLSADGYADAALRAGPGETASAQLTSLSPPDNTEVAGPDAAPPAPDTDDAESLPIKGTPQPDAFALVVGIQDYRSIAATPGARTDAQRVADMLQTTLGVPERNIRLLTDANATRSDIFAELSWLQNNVSDDSRIYFYFSGHGAPDVKTGASFLLPYEGRPETIEHSGISMDDVLDGLEQTEARDVLAFVDACFSGSGERSALPEGARPLVPTQNTAPKPNIALFSSSAATQISGNAPDADEGLFTRYLIRAIAEGRADVDGDGTIDLAELERYVAPRVTRKARRVHREQQPVLDVSEQLGDPSDIVVVRGLSTE